MFSASYRGFILRNKKVIVFVQRLLPQLDEHFPCRNAIFDPLWNLQMVSLSMETLIFVKIWSVVAHTVPGVPIKSQHLAPNRCQTTVKNHLKKTWFSCNFWSTMCYFRAVFRRVPDELRQNWAAQSKENRFLHRIMWGNFFFWSKKSLRNVVLKINTKSCTSINHLHKNHRKVYPQLSEWTL